MIGFLLDDGWLELASTSISVEISNPLFSYDAIPGTTTYPFPVPMSPANLRLLSFPHVRAQQGEIPEPVAAHCYIDGLLWRVGVLIFEECDLENLSFEYKFVSDAGELQQLIKGRTLDSLDLGTVALELTPSHPDYALPSIRNTRFYGGANAYHLGTLNYFYAGAYATASDFNYYPIVPCPRLMPLLQKVLAAFGYTLEGTWFDDAELRQLILWSNRAAEDVAGPSAGLPATIPLAQLLPPISVGDFLIQLQKFFAVGFSFDPVRRRVSILSLRDVVADPEYIEREGGIPKLTPPTGGGFAFSMELEADDEMNKTLDTSWSSLVVGAGKSEMAASAGTLHQVREVDVIADNNGISREWLVPAVEVKGASPAFGIGEKTAFGLRFLFDRGMQEDSNGELYPLATSDETLWNGTPVGSYSLRWGGAAGLYNQFHKPWLDFLNAAGTEERTVRFRIADLLALDPARKDMLAGRKYLWQKVSLTVRTGGRLESARITYRPTRS